MGRKGYRRKISTSSSSSSSDDEHQQQQHHFSLMGRREPPRLDDCYLSISPSPYFHPSESLGEMDRCFKCRRRLRNHCDCQCDCGGFFSYMLHELCAMVCQCSTSVLLLLVAGALFAVYSLRDI